MWSLGLPDLYPGTPGGPFLFTLTTPPLCPYRACDSFSFFVSADSWGSGILGSLYGSWSEAGAGRMDEWDAGRS